MRPIGVAGQKQLVALLDRLRAALETAEASKVDNSPDSNGQASGRPAALNMISQVF